MFNFELAEMLCYTLLKFSEGEGDLMHIAKEKLETFLKDLPEEVDTEEVMYRLYLLQKIETGEKDIREGRTVTHEEAVTRLSRKWRH